MSSKLLFKPGGWLCPLPRAVAADPNIRIGIKVFQQLLPGSIIAVIQFTVP
jgi:hypothetical protein